MGYGVARLLYGILGWVSVAGFNARLLDMSGGVAWQRLAIQLRVGSAVGEDPLGEELEEFDFYKIAPHSDGWIAVDEGAGRVKRSESRRSSFDSQRFDYFNCFCRSDARAAAISLNSVSLCSLFSPRFRVLSFGAVESKRSS